jgi:hypothetical protein
VQLFHHGGQRSPVIKVERVINSKLWLKYQHACSLLQSHGSGGVNEMWLFHGTRGTTPTKIVEGGVDFRHASSGMFGKGAYFSESSSYSHAYSHKTSMSVMGGSPVNVKQMFLARVAAGNVELRNSDNTIIKPSSGYDSIRGSVNSTTNAIIVYDLGHSFPEYLISYQA